MSLVNEIQTKTCLQDQDLLHLGLINKTENETEKILSQILDQENNSWSLIKQDPDCNFKN